MEEPPRIEEIFTGIDKVFKTPVPFAVFLAVLFIVIGGYMWMTSSGEPERVKKAQGTLTWAIIGLIFVLLVYLILNGIVDYIEGL
jgi:type IV secretory pathway VirB2 component (pilin)